MDILNIVKDFYNIKRQFNIISNNTNIKKKTKIEDKDIDEFNQNKNNLILPDNYSLFFFENTDLTNSIEIFKQKNITKNIDEKNEISKIKLFDYYLSKKYNLISGQTGGKINLLGRKRNIIIKKQKQYVKVNNEIISLKKALNMHKKYLQNK